MRRRRVVGTAVVGLVLLAGCGTGSAPSPSSGIDGLEIPTPAPDPRDFVDVVDNSWVAPGAARFTTASGATVEQSVAAGPEVADVSTTAVTIDGVTDYLAQDEQGNVWWFGRAGSWLADGAGAEAGLLMAAVPRLGDGYRQASVPGSDQRARVADLDEDTVVLEVVTDLEVERLTYERGRGLVRVESASGDVELERVP